MYLMSELLIIMTCIEKVYPSVLEKAYKIYKKYVHDTEKHM